MDKNPIKWEVVIFLAASCYGHWSWVKTSQVNQVQCRRGGGRQLSGVRYFEDQGPVVQSRVKLTQD